MRASHGATIMLRLLWVLVASRNTAALLMPNFISAQLQGRNVAISLSNLANGNDTNVEAFEQMEDSVEVPDDKDSLLSAIAAMANEGGIGWGASSPEKAKFSQLAKELAGYALPLTAPSEWRLIYTDAPDLLGFRGGPLSQLVNIRQSILNEDNLEVILEYQPSGGIINALSNIGSFEDIASDRLEQAVCFDYQKEPLNKIALQLKGTKLEGTRFGSLPPLQIPAGLPLGSFQVLFNDGELCVQETIQGEFLSIYERMD